MKKIALIISLLFIISWNVDAQKVNEKIQIEHSGTWYDGTVIKVNAEEGKY